MIHKAKITHVLWLLILIFIPLLSIYGRSVQGFIKENLSPSNLKIILGFVLLMMIIKAVYWLMRNHSYKRIWHLVWFIPIFLVIPYFMPIVEERVHFIVFGSFGLLSGYIFSAKTAIIICISISTLDEGLQWYLPDRVGDWNDISINILASLAGAIFSIITRKD